MKLISLTLIGFLIISGIIVIASSENDFIIKKELETIIFSDLNIFDNDENDYVSIQLDKCTTNIVKTGEPLIPYYTKKITFPLGTNINNIEVSFSNAKILRLHTKIIPAPKPTISDLYEFDNQLLIEEKEIYNSGEFYPSDEYVYNLYSGRDGGDPAIILIVQCYPIRYSPATDIILYFTEMDINIIYEIPLKPIILPDEKDMVIISPSKFSKNLQPLVEHKNRFNVRTILKSTEEIYSNYNGRDNPEKIKYYIKDAYETLGIDYVMLVGGMKSQIYGTARDDKNQGSKSWYIPVRYTNIKDGGSIHDPGYISDLYYADLYKIDNNEIVFDDWDSTGNDIFAEWSNFVGRTDKIDHFPDVFVGRLACRNNIEVIIMVDKIIKYENTLASSSWFNRMIVIGGDSHNDVGTNLNEGEIVGNKALSYLPSFEPVKLYASNKDVSGGLIPGPDDIINEISNGAGFVLFDGHGHPGSWNTHWPGEYTWSDTPGGISISKFPKLSNEEKLPIVLIGGCHNSQFNVTLLSTILEEPFMWTHGTPVPECFSWWLTRKIDGGAIATFGSTGLGYGYVGNNSDIDGNGIDEPDTLEGLGGYTEVTFFKKYSEGINILGNVWGATLDDYLSVFPPMNDKIQMKSIQEWPLLGDPSLMIGGYS